MKKLFGALFVLSLLFVYSPAQAKTDIADQFADALMLGEAQTLENILAPNFWFIGPNGHIRDKEHFLEEIKAKSLVINRITLTNERETKIGATRLLTANGTFKGIQPIPGPDGLMRFTMIIADNKGKEQVALFQATPVIASPDCQDGNCKIK